MNSTSPTVLVHGASPVPATADQMLLPDGRHDLAARTGADATSVDASCAVALSRRGGHPPRVPRRRAGVIELERPGDLVRRARSHPPTKGAAMLEDWKQRRAVKRIKSGDGRPLQPFRWWQLLSQRALLTLRLVGRDGRDVVYAVDVRHWGKQGGAEGKAHLFVNGRHHAESKLPAAFPVEGGTIEVALSTYGLRRAHYITTGGAERQLVPDPKSGAGRRLRLDRRHPVASRIVAAVSVVMLVAGVGLNLLQAMEPITGIPPVAERFGRFESPIHLPLWLNIALGMGAVLASMERGLRLRYHWLLDGAGS